MNKKRTYTYFMIIGNFQTKEIIQLLDIEPIEKNDIGDNGKYKNSLDFASVKLAISYKNTLIIEEQVQEIIEFCHLTNSTIDCDLYDMREKY